MKYADLRKRAADLEAALLAIVNELDWEMLHEVDRVPSRSLAHARLYHNACLALGVPSDLSDELLSQLEEARS